jgi:uncharacterized protein YcaQ
VRDDSTGHGRNRLPGRGNLRRTIRRLGLLQIDYVLAPAHYQVPHRVGPCGFEKVLEQNAASADFVLEELRGRTIWPLGIGTVDHLADYYRMPVREAGPRITELVEAGALRAATVEAGARLPRRIDAASLLSPFDPVVWFLLGERLVARQIRPPPRTSRMLKNSVLQKMNFMPSCRMRGLWAPAGRRKLLLA